MRMRGKNYDYLLPNNKGHGSDTGKPVYAKTGRWTKDDKQRFINEASTRQITPTKTPLHARPKARPPTSVFMFDIRAVEARVLKFKESIIFEVTHG